MNQAQITQPIKQANKGSYNKGFTLVELIVSIAIFAIVGAAIIAFFSMAMTQYKRNTNETNVQTESQMAWKRLENNILITTDGIWTPSNHQIDLYSYEKGGTHEYLRTQIYYGSRINQDGESEDSAASDKNAIYYQEQYYDTTKSKWIDIGEPQVFANLVTDFDVRLYDKGGEIKLYDDDGNPLSPPGTRPTNVKVNISYEANERTYDSSNEVAIRNNIVASNRFNAVYANTDKYNKND